MRNSWVLVLGALLPLAAVAGQPAGGKPDAACEKQHAQCMKQCDKEKRLWLFKGEAYESCAEKCEARAMSCAATGTGETDDGEADEDRRQDAGRRQDADRRQDDDRSRPQDEDLDQNDTAEMDDDDAAATEEKGKGKADERRRENKDRSTDDSETESDE